MKYAFSIVSRARENKWLKMSKQFSVSFNSIREYEKIHLLFDLTWSLLLRFSHFFWAVMFPKNGRWRDNTVCCVIKCSIHWHSACDSKYRNRTDWLVIWKEMLGRKCDKMNSFFLPKLFHSFMVLEIWVLISPVFMIHKGLRKKSYESVAVAVAFFYVEICEFALISMKIFDYLFTIRLWLLTVI